MTESMCSHESGFRKTQKQAILRPNFFMSVDFEQKIVFLGTMPLWRMSAITVALLAIKTQVVPEMVCPGKTPKTGADVST